MACTVCWNCGSRLPAPKSATGRLRRFCSHRCQQAAWRAARRAGVTGAPDDPGVEQLIDVLFVVQNDPLEASIELLMTLRASAGRARRLARTGPPQLRWRHESTAAELDDLLSRLWPVP